MGLARLLFPEVPCALSLPERRSPEVWVCSERGGARLHGRVAHGMHHSAFQLKTVCLVYCCSVAKSYLTLCDPMDCNTPGFPVLHYLLEFAQTHVYCVSDAIQQSQSRLTLCDPMNCNTPGFPVLHYLLEFVQTHVH